MNVLNKQLLITLLYLTMTIASCNTPKLTDTPQPTRELNQYDIYIPFDATIRCLQKDSRLGLAYSVNNMNYKDVLEMLCMQYNSPIRTWSYRDNNINNFIPTMWGTEYIEQFKQYYNNRNVGNVLMFNEPGAVGQATGHIIEIASEMVLFHNWCDANDVRNCNIIGPGFASDDREALGRASFNSAVEDIGGNPNWFTCDAHLYIFPEHIPNFNILKLNDLEYVKEQLRNELSFRLTALRSTGQCKGIYISEIGVCYHWPYAEYWLQYQLEYLLEQPDVLGIYVFVDSNYWWYQPCPYYLEYNGNLTGIGYAILNVGTLPSYSPVESYP